MSNGKRGAHGWRVLYIVRAGPMRYEHVTPHAMSYFYRCSKRGAFRP